MKHIAIVCILLLLPLVAGGCKNLSVGFKYGDWGFEKEFKLSEIQDIKIEVEEITDQAKQDIQDTTAPIIPTSN